MYYDVFHLSLEGVCEWCVSSIRESVLWMMCFLKLVPLERVCYEYVFPQASAIRESVWCCVVSLSLQCGGGTGACPDDQSSAGTCSNSAILETGFTQDGSQCVVFTRNFSAGDISLLTPPLHHLFLCGVFLLLYYLELGNLITQSGWSMRTRNLLCSNSVHIFTNWKKKGQPVNVACWLIHFFRAYTLLL